MASLNKITLIGNLGRDPEIKYINETNPVAKFSLATTESYKDKNGEWVDNTEWHNIVAWRYLAEKAAKNLKKGMQVYVEGKVTYRNYDDKDGNKKYITEIVASNIINLSRKESSSSDTIVSDNVNNEDSSSASFPSSSGNEVGSDNPTTDDLPF